MISKSLLKYVKSLQQKKNREEHRKFLVEGSKSILEVASSNFDVEVIVCTEKFYSSNEIILKKFSVEIAKEAEVSDISSFKNNNAGVAVCKQKATQLSIFSTEPLLLLDDIKDPGNLGTIIRIADWYGFKKVICSPETVEFYNPKVISATMGSFTRMECFYEDLVQLIDSQKDRKVYGALLNGNNIYETVFEKNAIIVIGNESKGISEGVQKLVSDKITIPSFGEAESLNAGVATGIFLDNFRRIVG